MEKNSEVVREICGLLGDFGFRLEGYILCSFIINSNKEFVNMYKSFYCKICS